MANDLVRPPPYRREAFTHILNLAALAAVGVAGLWDYRLWAVAVPVELAVLWMVPDLPPFRKWVEVRHEDRLLLEERSSYLEQLWGLTPSERRRGLRSWLVEEAPENPDLRVQDQDAPEFQAYLEMRSIVARLRELLGVRGVHVTEVDIGRCEEVITGYLRLLIACQPLRRAVAGVDLARLDREIATLDRQLAEPNEGPLRAALGERRQLLMHQRARAPRLEATLELFQARADAIVQQLRNIHGQVLADPGMNVNELLDQVMDKHEALTDPLSQASAEQLVDEFLRRPSVRGRLETPEPPAVDPPPVQRPPRRPLPNRQKS